MVAGFQTVVAWRAAQGPLDRTWARFLPVAVMPLWQDEQLVAEV